MKEYLALQNETQHKAFVSTYVTRWCELARLPYFDVCHMIVIDPMHNLLLGMLFVVSMNLLVNNSMNQAWSRHIFTTYGSSLMSFARIRNCDVFMTFWSR